MPNLQAIPDSTRDRLILAALKIFGERGFDGTSTRQLAAAAGVNLAAIPYHFGGKQGLYLACAEYVAERVGALLLPTVAEINTFFSTDPAAQKYLSGKDLSAVANDNKALARELLHTLIRRFADVLICTEEADAWSALVLREQANPTDAFEVLYRKVMQPVSVAIYQLTGATVGLDINDTEVKILSTTILGQIQVFRISRAGVLRNLEWDRYTPQRTAPIVDIIIRNVDACLDQARQIR